jgi:hypothetical protein
LRQVTTFQGSDDRPELVVQGITSSRVIQRTATVPQQALEHGDASRVNRGVRAQQASDLDETIRRGGDLDGVGPDGGRGSRSWPWAVRQDSLDLLGKSLAAAIARQLSGPPRKRG